jgi:integrase/recombinase XerD
MGSRMVGPLAIYAEGFRAELARLGYTPISARWQMGLMSHASRWAAEHELQASDLAPETIDRFLALRRAQGRKEWISPIGMAPLLEYLRGLGVVPTPVPRIPTTPSQLLLNAYDKYLTRERSLAPSTVSGYLNVARAFLAHPPIVHRQSLEELTAAEVLGFVQQKLHARPRCSVQYVATGVRAFLRFLFVDGRIARPLATVVPKAAKWRLRSLPRVVGPGDIERLLAGCDRSTAIGLRACGVITILARLGLRAGEVANLKVADVDWRRGEITVTGKGNRTERLPLPTDVGEAIATWLQRGRPTDAGAYVFCRLRAPHVGLTSGGVSQVVYAAGVRAGIEPFYAHRLRHAAATQMLRAGADLTEIGQVLRHSRSETTAIYAKVDTGSLRTLALPWPGSLS